MEIAINWSELRKHKLFVATPMYGGMCTANFTRSLVDLASICTANGIPLQFYVLSNESLITRARAYACDEFMRSDATHMMFIDSDVGFSAQDIIAMLALQISEPAKYNILAGPYPKKCISWEKIVSAVRNGLGDANANDLEKYTGDYVFNPKNSTSIQISEPAEVLEAGTGFMMIPRATFEAFKEAYPEKSYRPDHVRTDHFDGSREIMMYFDCVIDKPNREKAYGEVLTSIAKGGTVSKSQIKKLLKNLDEEESKSSKRYLSEDYYFCQNINKLGLSVWLCPWMKLTHTGTYTWVGSLADLAMAQVSATADPSALGKNK
ncbi:MAG: hypothetical protein P4L79_10910 [Legionella sp.]|uniref:hypothetical protein n=1 Tax=Legionella sp. TaxID=459 RepID=UPI00283F609B|nr:hypothetical protein [Legionella sp.]